jgi:hypothetical protein
MEIANCSVFLPNDLVLIRRDEAVDDLACFLNARRRRPFTEVRRR